MCQRQEIQIKEPEEKKERFKCRHKCQLHKKENKSQPIEALVGC